MIVLTDRLRSIAEKINKGERVADIGTDHGYLPLYLKEKGISPHVVMIDVSKGSLAKAEENGKRLFPGENLDYRLGDGLEPLKNGEVDTVVMAGIGGNLMVDIMDWDIGKTISFKKFILQPRNNAGAVRRFLYEHGFTLNQLDIVLEDRRYCEILVVDSPALDSYRGRFVSDDIPQVEFDFPNELADGISPNSLNKDYIKSLLKLEESIVSNIIAGRTANNEEVEEDAALIMRRERIKRLNQLLGQKG